MDISTYLLVPLQTWRLSKFLFSFILSTEDPSVLGSNSTCFVLRINIVHLAGCLIFGRYRILKNL